MSLHLPCPTLPWSDGTPGFDPSPDTSTPSRDRISARRLPQVRHPPPIATTAPSGPWSHRCNHVPALQGVAPDGAGVRLAVDAGTRCPWRPLEGALAQNHRVAARSDHTHTHAHAHSRCLWNAAARPGRCHRGPGGPVREQPASASRRLNQLVLTEAGAGPRAASANGNLLKVAQTPGGHGLKSAKWEQRGWPL